MYVIVYIVSVSVCLYVCVRDAAIWYAIILKHNITIINWLNYIYTQNCLQMSLNTCHDKCQLSYYMIIVAV